MHEAPHGMADDFFEHPLPPIPYDFVLEGMQENGHYCTGSLDLARTALEHV